MKTKEEILEKVSEIIETSEDKQVVLNACHFLYGVIKQTELDEKMEQEKQQSRERMKPLTDMMKAFAEV